MTDKQHKDVTDFIETIKQLSAFDLDNYKEVIAENLFFSGTAEGTVQLILNEIKQTSKVRMKLFCSQCNEFMLECGDFTKIDVRCPNCNQRHSNLFMKNGFETLDLSKPMEILTYVKTK